LGRVGNDSEDDESLDEQNLFGASPDPDPLEWAVGHDMREAIAFAREGLSPREAEIFGLWIDHDRTNSEIAQQLRITESAVRTFKYRASVKIAKHINQRKRDGDATRAR
jgi:DNA-binding CsgD family transcriptional regulator